MALEQWRVARRVRALEFAALMVVIPGALSGCGQANSSPDQVLVKGDGFEITVQEYDQVLKRSPLVTREAVAPMRSALMEGLISEKLLADEAVKAGLDKQAATMQAIAAARRSVLAQMYAEKLSGGALPFGDRDIEQYYAAHQAQFSQRRRFVISEYVVRSDLPEVRRYVEMLDKRGMAELGNYLRSAMPAIAPVTLVRFSDEIPDTASATLQHMHAGNAIIYQTPGQLHLGEVQSIEADPVLLDAVRPRIEASIAAERRNALIKATVDKLRKTRKIEVLQTSLASSEQPSSHSEAQQ